MFVWTPAGTSSPLLNKAINLAPHHTILSPFFLHPSNIIQHLFLTLSSHPSPTFLPSLNNLFLPVSLPINILPSFLSHSPSPPFSFSFPPLTHPLLLPIFLHQYLSHSTHPSSPPCHHHIPPLPSSPSSNSSSFPPSVSSPKYSPFIPPFTTLPHRLHPFISSPQYLYPLFLP